MRRTTAAAALGLALAIGVAACGGGKSVTEKAVEKASGGKVKVNDNGITVKGNGGEANLGGSQLPTDFPKGDVPVPKDATLVASSFNTQDGKKSWFLTYTVKSDASSVLNSYQSALTSAGFRIDNASSGGASGGSYQMFTAVGTTYDVNVAGGASTSSDAGFVVTVQPHDTSNDTTTTSG